LKKKTVERIYKVRERNKKKPLIVLISKIKDLEYFGIKINQKEKRILKEVWPGKVSVILQCKSKKFTYFHRGTKSIAFRLPKKKSLLDLLKKTGPMVAPSANTEGNPPAKNIKEAKEHFGDIIDFYQNSGTISGKPSKLIRLSGNKVETLR